MYSFPTGNQIHSNVWIAVFIVRCGSPSTLFEKLSKKNAGLRFTKIRACGAPLKLNYNYVPPEQISNQLKSHPRAGTASPIHFAPETTFLTPWTRGKICVNGKCVNVKCQKICHLDFAKYVQSPHWKMQKHRKTPLNDTFGHLTLFFRCMNMFFKARIEPKVICKTTIHNTIQ